MPSLPPVPPLFQLHLMCSMCLSVRPSIHRSLSLSLTLTLTLTVTLTLTHSLARSLAHSIPKWPDRDEPSGTLAKTNGSPHGPRPSSCWGPREISHQKTREALPRFASGTLKFYSLICCTDLRVFSPCPPCLLNPSHQLSFDPASGVAQKMHLYSSAYRLPCLSAHLIIHFAVWLDSRYTVQHLQVRPSQVVPIEQQKHPLQK